MRAGKPALFFVYSMVTEQILKNGVRAKRAVNSLRLTVNSSFRIEASGATIDNHHARSNVHEMDPEQSGVRAKMI
jgi:hypothetical protein